MTVRLYKWQIEALKDLDYSGRPATAAGRVLEKAIEEHQRVTASNERK